MTERLLQRREKHCRLGLGEYGASPEPRAQSNSRARDCDHTRTNGDLLITSGVEALIRTVLNIRRRRTVADRSRKISVSWRTSTVAEGCAALCNRGMSQNPVGKPAPALEIQSSWLNAALAGSSRAFAELLEAFRPQLLRLAADHLGSSFSPTSRRRA